MGPISLSTPVDAPREEVFDFICDLSARPAWTDHFVSEYHLERIQAAGEGAAARFRVDAPAGVRYMETVIAETERPHRIEERGRGGRLDRFQINAVWELSAGPGSVTTVGLVFWTEPPTPQDRMRELGRSRWWRRRWKKSLRRMRVLVEEGPDRALRVGVAGADRLPAS